MNKQLADYTKEVTSVAKAIAGQAGVTPEVVLDSYRRATETELRHSVSLAAAVALFMVYGQQHVTQEVNNRLKARIDLALLDGDFGPKVDLSEIADEKVSATLH